MGCITSRGEHRRFWPPRPYPRFLIKPVVINGNNRGVDATIVSEEADYVWVYPGSDFKNGCGGVAYDFDEEQSPAQEIAIRILEDG